MENTKKILMICTSSQGIYNFRLPLIKKFKDEGYDVFTIAFDDKYADTLKEDGVNFRSINDNNRSTNPIKILTLKKKYLKIIKEINPDIVFTFQLKPNLFGAPAAKKAGVKKIFSMVEGAGDAFIETSLKWKLIRFIECKLYKKAFRNVNKVFFLNNDDKSQFVDLKLVKNEQCEIVNGIGVDLDKFAFEKVNKESNKFIMIARMLKTKGVFDYIKCAEIVKQSHPEAEFLYLGAEGSVKIADIQEFIDNKTINYLGTAKDVRPYVKDSIALMLPSYREGIPMTIMEAESIGRAIITTNNIGCKETVKDEYNGFLIEGQDYQTMAQKCIYLLENKAKAVEFGSNARKFAEEKFNQQKINQTIFDIVDK